MAKLEEMRRGDWVRWGSADWEVTGRSLYRESADYQETQWVLESGWDTRYLVRSEEKKGGGTEVVWVCTKQTGIGRVRRPDGDGWTPFRETGSLSSPPPKVRLDETDFSLEGETEGTAEDDDGNNVTKLTWDYYDASRKRNLAIEVWQEPDADYYEAYDGQVVAPGDFAQIPPPPRKLPRLNREDFGALVIGFFGCLFFLPIVAGMMGAFDTGAEYLVALLLPALALGLAYSFGTHRGMLAACSLLGAGAAIAVLKTRGLGATYWEYAAYGLAAGPAGAELSAALFGDARRSDKPWAAACGSLLAMFVISFAHYVSLAPRPHDAGLLLAACALTLPPPALAFAGYFLFGGSGEQA